MDPVNESRPTYLVVADRLRGRIASGEFAVGSKLPAGKELAEEYGVAPNTVLAAVRALREEGVVFSQQGRGTFVRGVDPQQLREASASPEFLELSARLDDILSALDALTRRVSGLERTVQSSAGDAEGD
jgi:DNA-binding GntR family transcriptional regulator